MTASYKVAYLSRMVYPKTAAHALQSMQMAAAFARQSGDGHLFVRFLTEPHDRIFQYYCIEGSPLHVWSLHGERLPVVLRGYYGHAAVHNLMVAILVGLQPEWRKAEGKRKVFFVRSERDYPYLSYWKTRLPWLRSWFFIYEAHDVAGLEPKPENAHLNNRNDVADTRHRRLLRDLGNFDLVECVTQALADDLRQLSNGHIQPFVVRHASALPRSPRPPAIKVNSDTLILGYVGTIDTYRGVDKLLHVMRFLPKNYHLRLVGRIVNELDNDRLPDWLNKALHDPEISNRIELVPAMPVHQVAQEIDRCDILLQPASDHIFTLRYAAPLKSFDYMVRGKPIIAADVPCHRELFQDEVNAVLYSLDDVEHLAARICYLAERPRLMETIARNAWEQSADYTYDARARRVLSLVDELWEQRHAARSA